MTLQINYSIFRVLVYLTLTTEPSGTSKNSHVYKVSIAYKQQYVVYKMNQTDQVNQIFFLK